MTNLMIDRLYAKSRANAENASAEAVFQVRAIGLRSVGSKPACWSPHLWRSPTLSSSCQQGSRRLTSRFIISSSGSIL